MAKSHFPLLNSDRMGSWNKFLLRNKEGFNFFGYKIHRCLVYFLFCIFCRALRIVTEFASLLYTTDHLEDEVRPGAVTTLPFGTKLSSNMTPGFLSPWGQFSSKEWRESEESWTFIFSLCSFQCPSPPHYPCLTSQHRWEVRMVKRECRKLSITSWKYLNKSGTKRFSETRKCIALSYFTLVPFFEFTFVSQCWLSLLKYYVFTQCKELFKKLGIISI